jgi:hypothetical protein
LGGGCQGSKCIRAWFKKIVGYLANKSEKKYGHKGQFLIFVPHHRAPGVTTWMPSQLPSNLIPNMIWFDDITFFETLFVPIGQFLGGAPPAKRNDWTPADTHFCASQVSM